MRKEVSGHPAFAGAYPIRRHAPVPDGIFGRDRTWLRFFKPAMVEAVLYEYRVSGTPLSALHAAQQQAASQIVRRRFADLDLAEVLPWALPELAEALGAPLHAAGRLAYALWQHPGAAFSLPETALKPLAAMLPDRTLEPVGTAAPWWLALGLPEGSKTQPRGVSAKPFR